MRMPWQHILHLGNPQKNETLLRGSSAPPLISLQLLAGRVRKLSAVLIQVTWNK